MRTPSIALLAPLAAAVAGWMLSGSPVPMALTLAVSAVALVGGFLSPRLPKGEMVRLIPPLLLALAALWIEWRLFEDGRALAMRAEMPFSYHAGIALLWWATADQFLRSSVKSENGFPFGAFTGLTGGLFVLGASADTVLYDFGPWEAHPVAALPLMLWSAGLVLPLMKPLQRTTLVVLPGCLALTGLVLASSSAMTELRPWFYPDDKITLDPSLSRAPEIGTRGPLGDAASRKLPREADLKFRREIVARIRAHAPSLYRSWSEAPLYLRTSTLALFESDELISPIRSGRWLYDLDDGIEDQRIDLETARRDEIAEDPATRHTYYVDHRTLGHLPLVSDAVAIHTPAVYEFADDWYQLSAAEEIRLLRYTASVTPNPVAELRGADLTSLRTTEIPGVYLQLPPSPLSGKIRELCATFPPEDPLGSIRRFLATQTSYSLRFSTPEGSSPLGEFLFGHGRGHCEHFAAATVLMLRGLGIPSRVSYGFAGGIADPGQRLFAFRDSDFHAWAEVLTPNSEWKIFDTTPRVPNAASRMPVSESLPVIDELPYHDLSEFDEATRRTGRDWNEILLLVVSWLSRHFFPVSAISLGVIAALGWFMGRRGHKQDHLPNPVNLSDEIPEPPAFLREIERVASRVGLRKRPGQTWRELLDQLSGRMPLPSVATEAVRYHYETAYAGKRRDERSEAHFLERLRTWSE
jgi:transglutaminase-like putative cysteine protease